MSAYCYLEAWLTEKKNVGRTGHRHYYESLGPTKLVKLQNEIKILHNLYQTYILVYPRADVTMILLILTGKKNGKYERLQASGSRTLIRQEIWWFVSEVQNYNF